MIQTDPSQLAAPQQQPQQPMAPAAPAQQGAFNLKAYLPLLATAYGEGANQSPDVKRHILSTILNRAESGKAEFGADTGRLTDVLKKGYYAYSNNTPLVQQAMSQKFPDSDSENSFKEFVSLFSGMLKGSVKRSDSIFYFKPSEEKSMRAKGKKSFNFDLVEPTGKSGPYNFYKYKSSPGRKR